MKNVSTFILLCILAVALGLVMVGVLTPEVGR